MIFFRPPSAEILPEVVLTDWKLFDVSFPSTASPSSQHLVGSNMMLLSQYVSSPVTAIWREGNDVFATTQSGRMFSLVNPVLEKQEAISETFTVWLDRNRAETHVDKTTEILQEIGSDSGEA